MGLQTNTIAIETLESRTLMASTGADCVHAAPAEPGAQGYKVQHFDRPSVGVQRAASLNAKISIAISQANQIEAALTWVTGRKVFDQRIYYFPTIPTSVSASMVIWVGTTIVWSASRWS